ncbi:MAG: oligosaccharide flippase family protein [Chloroflexi bacterium]|nr:oligosaccharide flippase family protein [Chloroflexota bacterium]
MSTTITGAEARRAARNAGAIAAASILSRGLQFGWQLLLASALGPALYGVYGAVAAFIMVGSAIPNFGMGPIVVRDVARYPDKAGRYLTATLFMQTILALLAYVGLNAAAGLGGYSETVRAFVAIASISLIVDILGSMGNDILLAQERMLASSAVSVGYVVLLVALAGLGLATGYGLFGVYVGTIIAGVCRSAALWALLLRGGTRPVWPFDRSIAWPLLVNGAPLALAAFLSLAYQQADKLLTNRLIGDAETGYLSVAFVLIFGVVELLNTTILLATFPLMSRAYGDGRNPLFGFMVEKLSFFTLLVSLPICLLLSVFAAEITVPLFGEDFRPTADVLRILIWYALVTMFANVMAQGLTVQNRQRRTLLIRAAGLVVNVVLLLALLPVLGVRGAAVASVGAELLVLALLLATFHADGWDVRRLLPRLLRLAALGTGVALVMLALRGLSPIVGMVTGVALYGAGALALNILAPDDWDLLYRLVAAMPGSALIRRYWRREVKLNW